MGYYVRQLKEKKKIPQWKIQFVSYKRKDQREGNQAKMPKRTWDISKDRWPGLGFHSSMTFKETQVRARQLNAQLHLERQEERIKEIQEKERKFRLRHEATLPDEFVFEFEARFVRPKGIISEGNRRQRTIRRFTIWRATQRMIATIAI